MKPKIQNENSLSKTKRYTILEIDHTHSLNFNIDYSDDISYKTPSPIRIINKYTKDSSSGMDSSIKKKFIINRINRNIEKLNDKESKIGLMSQVKKEDFFPLQNLNGYDSGFKQKAEEFIEKLIGNNDIRDLEEERFIINKERFLRSKYTNKSKINKNKNKMINYNIK
jgi:hypothetical protein